MEKPGAQRLYEMLERNHVLGAEIDGRDFPLNAFDCLQQWQQQRLARTFEDLIRQQAYRLAVNFFLSELYGGLDFRDRDEDMSKVMPVMKRFLPDKVLYIMSEAFELQAMSLEFDMRMAAYMEQQGYRELDMARYCETYLACSDRPGRERQIQLIRKLGYDLDRLVNKPLVNTLVRLLRGPAHAAGFGKLQEFLEAGLGSFRALKDVRFFNETVYRREWDAMENMFAGQEKPFGFE
ncbi:MAG: hypothetical protein HKN57_11110 [Xanthomonadales bacterium]|nr:hypothetical protein [Gammaproteobacteria bacterium]MBT8054720.1 hypothetical protein [Gammaproteobacteria bacterium]NND57786.1 hypothetical protein [Xanthomonadales bacterium]NNK51435.1 hypothetical protein [Xanthomonadales bacterium]